MRRKLSALVTVLAVASLSAAAGGCQNVAKFGGCDFLVDTVTNPDPGTPEAVVQKIIASAMKDDEKEGWKLFKSTLHSNQLGSPASVKSWRTMNYSSFRRTHHLLLEDESKPVFKVCYKEYPTENEVDLFVYSPKSMPKKFGLQKDPKAGGKWRLENSIN